LKLTSLVVLLHKPSWSVRWQHLNEVAVGWPNLVVDVPSTTITTPPPTLLPLVLLAVLQGRLQAMTAAADTKMHVVVVVVVASASRNLNTLMTIKISDLAFNVRKANLLLEVVECQQVARNLNASTLATMCRQGVITTWEVDGVVAMAVASLTVHSSRPISSNSTVGTVDSLIIIRPAVVVATSNKVLSHGTPARSFWA
jgi:hypothetical protein